MGRGEGGRLWEGKLGRGDGEGRGDEGGGEGEGRGGREIEGMLRREDLRRGGGG